MPDDPRALDRQPADLTPPLRSDVAAPQADHHSRAGRRLLGFGALLLLAAGLAIGMQRHYRQHLEVAAAAEEQRDFVPRVRVAAVQPSPDIRKVVLPATTTAFEAANIFARASGYVVQRNVDIGSRVKAGGICVRVPLAHRDVLRSGGLDSTLRAPRPRGFARGDRNLSPLLCRSHHRGPRVRRQVHG